MINALGLRRDRGSTAHRDRIGRVYAGRHGIIGALTEDLIDTSKESARAIAALRSTPAGAFGSCRFKLKSLEATGADERLIEVFKAHEIGYFFYNGGGDSADTCFKVSQLSEAMGYPIQAIHVPKTVDNDLPITDCCRASGRSPSTSPCRRSKRRSTCARWRTSTKVFVLEVRPARGLDRGGRRAGRGPGIPVVILSRDRVRRAEVRRPGRRAGARARLLHGRRLRRAATTGRPFPRRTGHARRLRPRPARRRSAGGRGHRQAGPRRQVPLGRRRLPAARRHRVGTDVKQAYELGARAVKLALDGHNAVAPTIDRVSDAPYRYRLCRWPKGRQRREVHATRHPRRLRSPRSESYLRPPIRGEDHPSWDDGWQQYVTLKNLAVAKKLPTFEL